MPRVIKPLTKMIGKKLKQLEIESVIWNFIWRKGTLKGQLKKTGMTVKSYGRQLKKVLPNTKTCTVANIVNPVDNRNVPTGKDSANSFNQFFTSVGENLGKQFNDVNLECPCNDACRNSTFTTQSNDNDSFKFDDVSCDFVYSQICKMDNNNLGGGYFHRNAIRGRAAQMGRFLTKNP